MEIALGFIIAVFIAITGVGAGSMTTPMLILLLGMPTRQAVGTALIFGAAVKILTTPMYIARRQVNWRAFGLPDGDRTAGSADRYSDAAGFQERSADSVRRVHDCEHRHAEPVPVLEHDPS